MATQFDATKNDMIIGLAQKFLADSTMMRNYVTDLSMFAVKGTKSISVPKLSGFTATNRDFNVAGGTQVANDSVDTINLDQNAYLAWSEDHSDIIQSTLEYRMLAVERAAKAHGIYVDQNIISGLEGAAGLDLASLVDVTNADVLDMREYILEAGGYEAWGEAAYFVSVDQDKALLKLEEFKRADVYGSANIPSGMIGSMYGAPVIVHNGLQAGQVLCFAKSGYGLAFQKDVAMSEQDDNTLGTMGKRVAMDCLFGSGALQVGERGAAAGTSPLIAKLK